jgi:hypothetical protein
MKPLEKAISFLYGAAKNERNAKRKKKETELKTVRGFVL